MIDRCPSRKSCNFCWPRVVDLDECRQLLHSDFRVDDFDSDDDGVVWLVVVS